MNVPELLAGKRVCVCAGSGGVGKTTTSAVVALGMATRGLKVCVITIDPARRLANALGLEELTNAPSRVNAAHFADAGLEVTGELWAMMLDAKLTFDELIEDAAPNGDRATAIKANPIYQQLSSAVAGSQEFTAVSKLFELATKGDFDLLVLDTPPSRDALEFLEAPGRLTAFLEGRAMQAFLRPTGLGLRVVGIGAAPLISVLRRITGVDLISDIARFLALLAPMGEQFSARAHAVERLLASEATAFLLVCSAQPGPVEEAIWFRQEMASRALPFAGVVVNRYHHDLGTVGTEQLITELTPALGGDADLAGRVAANFAEYHQLALRDAGGLERLAARLGTAPVLPVPQFDSDIHDVAGLMRVHAYLFGSDAEREALIRGVVA